MLFQSRWRLGFLRISLSWLRKKLYKVMPSQSGRLYPTMLATCIFQVRFVSLYFNGYGKRTNLNFILLTRIYGHLVSTYESASTRRFLLGRVDCIRSATSEALEWVKAMNQDGVPNVSINQVDCGVEPIGTQKVSYTKHSVSGKSLRISKVNVYS